jgi:hypothetical protein
MSIPARVVSAICWQPEDISKYKISYATVDRGLGCVMKNEPFVTEARTIVKQTKIPLGAVRVSRTGRQLAADKSKQPK